MTTKEFRRQATQGGYAYGDTVKDYCELHDEPYTEDDIVAVTRLQDWRDAHDPYNKYFCEKDEDYKC